MKRYLFLAGILGAILLSGCSSGGGEVSGKVTPELSPGGALVVSLVKTMKKGAAGR